MILLAYAKINLFLRVLRRRPDGYHDLLTLMQTVSLADRLTLETTEREGINLTCDDPALPTDEGNLAYRAAALFYRALSRKPCVSLHLEKQIPSQAGLGGGSSDAACVLNGLNATYGNPLERETLQRLAAELGSDVPFFFRRGCALAEGRGERLTPKSLTTPLYLLLICPPFGVETAWAYGNVIPQPHLEPEFEKRLSLTTLDIKPLLPSLRNDLESGAIARYPEIDFAKRWLNEHGAGFAMMTGSGSAIFGLFTTEEETQKARADWERALDTLPERLRKSRTFALHAISEGFEVEGETVRAS